jgi:hypothetical protein
MSNERPRVFEVARPDRSSSPEYQQLYAEELERRQLWQSIVAAREASGESPEAFGKRLGLTAAQVLWLEARGHETITVEAFRGYAALLNAR